MKASEFRKLKAGMARAGLAMFGLPGLALAATVSLSAQEAPATIPPSGQVETAYLDYQNANYSYMNWESPVGTRSSAFKKEPAFSGGKVIRGALQPGGRGSEEMAFAWDRTAGKLYLDLNRNLDLTDDEGGVFSSAGVRGGDYQTFTNIHVPVRTAAGSQQMLVNLSFYNYGSQPGCTVAMHSFWQGKVTLQGAEWQVGLLGTPAADRRVSVEGGNLLLRPWAERNKPFNLHSGTLTALPFSWKVFFGNRAYQLQCTNEVLGDSVKVRMRFTEQEPKLGELKITGDSVQRVTLEGGPYLVVLDKPEALVKVPVGRYRGARVSLKRGDIEAHLDELTQAARGAIIVSENKPAVLTAGGPLTNSVSLNRHGKNLVLNYQLVGAGGAYQLANQDRSHPPEFTIYQGDKKVASGKFEFG
jgi:hypothetical protein